MDNFHRFVTAAGAVLMLPIFAPTSVIATPSVNKYGTAVVSLTGGSAVLANTTSVINSPWSDTAVWVYPSTTGRTRGRRRKFTVSVTDVGGDRPTRSTTLEFDPEDVIAIGAFVVAILFAVAMIFGAAPIDKYTVSIVGFSGAAAAIIGIIKARRAAGLSWFERGVWIIVVLALAVALWLKR
jgi:hypothetical protein